MIVSGGGTGGHLNPALVLGRAMARVRPGLRPVFVGARRGLEARVLPSSGMEHHLLRIRGFQRGAALANVGLGLSLLRAVAGVALLFRRLDPVAVICTGGYASGPAGLGAVLLGIPLVLQEQNSVPGVTTRVLSVWARRIHVAFPETVGRLPERARDRARVSGNPVEAPRDIPAREARAALGLDAGSRVVLVVGGSQGAMALNRAVLEAVRRVEGGTLPSLGDVQLLWSTGDAHVLDVQRALEELGDPGWVRAVGYIEDMASALASADLAVSRAGAMATSEFLAWAVPALLVPLPTAAEGHQRRNAEALQDAGFARVLLEEHLTAETLWDALRRVLDPVASGDAFLEEARRRLGELEPVRGPEAYAERILEDVPHLDARLGARAGAGAGVAASPSREVVS